MLDEEKFKKVYSNIQDEHKLAISYLGDMGRWANKEALCNEIVNIISHYQDMISSMAKFIVKASDEQENNYMCNMFKIPTNCQRLDGCESCVIDYFEKEINND